MVTNFRKRYFFILLFLIQLLSSQGQINYPGKPIFDSSIDTTFIPVIDLIVDNPIVKKTKSDNGLSYKVDEFAQAVDVDINTSDYGVWLNYNQLNKKVWLIRIKSERALSINVLFDKYELLPGVKLFIYNREQSQIIGALTHRNNKSWKRLATSPINSDEIFIEMQMPIAQEDFGTLNIGQVGIEKAIESKLKSTQDEWFGRSASCHVNVNCYQDAHIQRQKSSTCRIIYQGGRRCTGTLLNNLLNDGVPYVITAAHCFTTDLIANDAVFGFNYESPTCEDIDGLPQSITGASVVSTISNLDFVLLRLSENIPLDYDPYFSGWDARGLAPQSSYILHHPEGDIRKISIDEDQATTSSWGGKDPNTHWLVADYEAGSTEDGSSGCGLISDENLLLGTLTGGGTTCSDYITDYYQKFSNSFNDYPNPENQLKAWLDPRGTNKLTCLGYDGSKAFRNTAQLLTNLVKDDVIETIKSEDNWGYLSGHNYQGNRLFAEKIQLNGSKYLYGVNMELVEQDYNIANHKNNLLTIWEGGATPGKILYEIPVTYTDPEVFTKSQRLELDFDSTILVHNSFYIGYNISYNSDTFAVRTATTKEDMNSAFTFINDEWQPLQFENTVYPSKLAIEVLAFDYLPEKGVRPDSSLISIVHVYPNPSRSQFQVYFKNEVKGKIRFKIYDLSGRSVFIQEWLDPDPNVPIKHNLPQGIYLLKIEVENKRYAVEKLLVF